MPTIASVSEDAIYAVPRELKEASLALGATHLETLTRVTIPAALSGIGTAVILGMSRAIGETMVVLMVAGGAAVVPLSIFDPVRPMLLRAAILVVAGALIIIIGFLVKNGISVINWHFLLDAPRNNMVQRVGDLNRALRNQNTEGTHGSKERTGKNIREILRRNIINFSRRHV